nr:hypothetical protein GCM10020241_07660 [Streptoalloteichus tenebrarius]
MIATGLNSASSTGTRKASPQVMFAAIPTTTPADVLDVSALTTGVSMAVGRHGTDNGSLSRMILPFPVKASRSGLGRANMCRWVSQS